MFEVFIELFSVAFSAFEIVLDNFEFVIIGVIAGMIVGVIPGMGGPVILSILLPLSIGMDSEPAFILLSAGMGATTFSGSITAILLNVPGTVSNAATLLDGYPMAREGRSAEAITVSALSSAIGATLAIIVFIILIPVIIDVALLFGSSEMVWIITLGLVVIPLLAGERFLGGLITASLGVVVAFMGHSAVTGQYRMTFGQAYLTDGVSIVPLAIGLFAIAEMLRLLAAPKELTIADSKLEIVGSRISGVKSILQNKFLMVRCSIIGFFIGTIPGAGGAAATFISYGHGVSSSKEPETFGQGNIQGLIASESANDAKDGGQLIPTLGLGIPGSPSMAILLGAFLVHGIEIGPRMLIDYTELMLTIAIALLISNILTSAVGVIFCNVISKVAAVPVTQLAPVILAISLMATFIVSFTFVDLYVAMIFGIFGLVLIKLGISRVPFLLAFVLGVLWEQNFHRAMIFADDSIYAAFFTGWLNLLLFAAVVIFLTLPLYRMYKN